MNRRITFAIPFMLAVLLATSALAQSPIDRDWWWHPAWGWGHMIFAGLTMIAFWGALIVLIVLLIRWVFSGTDVGRAGPLSRPTPLDILKERFAKGEIDKQEYEERKKLLAE